MKLKKPEILPDLKPEVNSGFLHLDSLIIGVDEVGRGCLAGPVVSAAAVLPVNVFQEFPFSKTGERPEVDSFRTHFFSQVKDSKLIPESKRGPLSTALKIWVREYAIAEGSVQEIAELNILYASHLAMERAVEAIEKKLGRKATCVLVDGNIVPKGLRDRGLAIIKGDQKSLSIACASVIAKVYRDDMMDDLETHYPGYGLKKHKGYPTPFHKAQVLALGPTEIHRMKFLEGFYPKKNKKPSL